MNPRLFEDQIAYIVNHAEDRLLFVDLTFVPLLEKIAAKLPTIERYVILTDKAHMPKTSLKGAVPYEDWIGEADGNFSWVEVDENDRLRHVLHLGHDRRAQGRRLQPPLECAAFAHRLHDVDNFPHFLARHGLDGRADVPCEFLVARLLGAR